MRIACDSLVALGNCTIDGAVVFAKNSDRPSDECQPLALLPRQSHADGARVRCTYIEILQVGETARVLGSRPYWCWGFEHGVNEHAVAIGNHTVFTKDGLLGQGLIGMDLVRLGLERARSADEAVDVITSLLERYGQGGSGYSDKEWPYHNSFLIADRSAAIVLETSDRHWATRRVVDFAGVSNHLSIAADWEVLSADAQRHAIEESWWPAQTQARFDFAAAYRDTSMAPEVVSSGRHGRTCALLAALRGKVGELSLRPVLRDHYGSAAPGADLTPDQPEYFSVCMHADPVGTTTASVIVRLAPDAAQPLLYWASLGSPCVGTFLPLFVDCAVPAALLSGGATPSEGSAWWQFKTLLGRVAEDWGGRLPRARALFDAFEAGVCERMSRERILLATPATRERFVADIVEQALQRAEELQREW